MKFYFHDGLQLFTALVLVTLLHLLLVANLQDASDEHPTAHPPMPSNLEIGIAMQAPHREQPENKNFMPPHANTDHSITPPKKKPVVKKVEELISTKPAELNNSEQTSEATPSDDAGRERPTRETVSPHDNPMTGDAESSSEAARQNAAPPPTSAGFNASYLHNPPPVYPSGARSRGWEGRVLIKVQVMPDGTPSHIELAKTSGHETLDEAALEAVSKWHFVPATQAGKNIAAWVLVPIDFKLSH